MRASALFVVLTVSTALACQPMLAAAATAKDDNSRYSYNEETDKTVDVNDPLQGFNQTVFQFNLAFDRAIEKPIIQVYDVVPRDVRHNVSNFLTNLSEPLNVIHGILQLKPEVAFTSLWRFILNTTFGLGGFRDFAREQAGLNNMDQDLGKTLGWWGFPSGPYVVLPVLGPSSVRDTIGRVGDWFADPVGWEENTPAEIAQAIADGIDTRDNRNGVIEHLYYQSLDPYIATRSAYRQHELFEESNRN